MKDFGCEDLLCEALDELLERNKKYEGYKLLTIVESTFSKFDYYLLLFSQLVLPDRLPN